MVSILRNQFSYDVILRPLLSTSFLDMFQFEIKVHTHQIDMMSLPNSLVVKIHMIANYCRPCYEILWKTCCYLCTTNA